MTTTSTSEVQKIRDTLWDVIFALKARADAEHSAADEAGYTGDTDRAGQWRAAAEESDTEATVLILAADRCLAPPRLIDEDCREVADSVISAWQAGACA